MLQKYYINGNVLTLIGFKVKLKNSMKKTSDYVSKPKSIIKPERMKKMKLCMNRKEQFNIISEISYKPSMDLIIHWLSPLLSKCKILFYPNRLKVQF